MKTHQVIQTEDFLVYAFPLRRTRDFSLQLSCAIAIWSTRDLEGKPFWGSPGDGVDCTFLCFFMLPIYFLLMDMSAVRAEHAGPNPLTNPAQ